MLLVNLTTPDEKQGCKCLKKLWCGADRKIHIIYESALYEKSHLAKCVNFEG